MGSPGASRVGRALGRLSLLCAAKPRSTIFGIMVLTVLMGVGMQQLSTEADLLLIMPKDDPNTLAAQNASREFRGFYDFVTVFYQIDPDKCEAVSASQLPFRLSEANCGNVTDEAYVRGMEEVSQFLKRELPSAEYAIDLAAIVKTVNWTNSAYADPAAGFLGPVIAGQPQQAGQPVPGTFAMPGTDPEGEFLYEAAWRGANAADDSIKDVVAPTWQAGRTLVFFNTSKGDLDRVELGRQFYAAVDKYAEAVQACDDGTADTAEPGRGGHGAPAADGGVRATAVCTLQWNVFSDKGLAVRGVSALDAHASDVTQRDIERLAPILVLALIAIMYLSFRDARVILVAAVNLVIAFVWTAGIMGFLGIPFTGLNLTIIPIILGVGIDYGIQMVSEYLDQKAQGKTDTEALGEAGGLAGMAMLVATVTTVAGLLIMVFSPSVLMAQLAIVTSIALTDCFLFALTMIPAMLVLANRGARERKPERGSAAILGLSSILGRHRWVTIVVLVVLSLGAAASARGLEKEAFGNPELNYPPGDRVRDDSQTINDLFFGGSSDTVSNYLIVEGDLTDPEAHKFLDALTVNLEQDPVLQGFNTASVTRIVRAWLSINQGTPDAIVNQFVLGNVPAQEAQDVEYPKTKEEMRAVFDDIFASPFANFMTILLNPAQPAEGQETRGYDMGMVPYDTHQDLGYDDAKAVWDATQRVIEKTEDETGYHGLRVHQFGNNAISTLFIEQELPWVQRVGIASFALVTILIGIMTRSWRATLAIASVMAISSLWFLGLLPPMGIGLSVGLMLPLVFISAIGSDNALHLIWNLEHVRDQARVYRFVGKAVTVAIFTDVIAFTVFCFQTDLLVRKTMLATVASVTSLWLATMLIVPLFYPPPRGDGLQGSVRKAQ